MKKILFSFAVIIATVGFTKANAAETKINQEEQKTITLPAKDAPEEIAVEAKEQMKSQGYICYVAKISDPYAVEEMDGSIDICVDVTVRCFWCYVC